MGVVVYILTIHWRGHPWDFGRTGENDIYFREIREQIV